MAAKGALRGTRARETLTAEACFILAVAVIPLVLAAVMAPVRRHVTNATAILVLFVVVIAASGDRLGGIVAALSSGVWFDFFLTPPVASSPSPTPTTSKTSCFSCLLGQR